MKGVTLISAVILIGVTLTAIAIIYQAGIPIIKKMQSTATVERMKQVFLQLDDLIQQVASEGNGSRRTAYIKLGSGNLVFNGSENRIEWTFESDAELVSPRSYIHLGNVIFGSNLDTKAYEDQYQGTDVYVLENEHLKVFFRKIGSVSSLQEYNTTDILMAVYMKDIKEWVLLESLEISLGSEESKTGSGYTILSSTGSDLPYATLTAYMNSSQGEYYINFTLESGADFIIVEGYR